MCRRTWSNKTEILVFNQEERVWIKKFELVAKISSEILSERNLTVGRVDFKKASTICFKLLRSNYNFGIVILCAPIF